MPSKIKKILIIRFSSIGDIVLTTPVIRNLKCQLKDVKIHYLIKNEHKEIIRYNPYVEKYHTLNNPISKTIQHLKNENFDLIIDLQNNLRTFIIKKRLMIKSQTVNKVNIKKWFYVNFKLNFLPSVHIVDRYMDTVKSLEIQNDNFGLDYFINKKDEISLNDLPNTHQKEFVAFGIGAKHNTKILPINKLIELCDKINKPIILLGSKEEHEKAEKIEHFFSDKNSSKFTKNDLIKMNKKTIIFNACGKYNLNQSASIIQKAKYVFTHDSGLMHIAAALKKEIFCIWGSTSPFFGMYPYQTKFTIFENNKINCRPCSKIGFKKCPKGHFKCMNDIVFDFYLP